MAVIMRGLCMNILISSLACISSAKRLSGGDSLITPEVIRHRLTKRRNNLVNKAWFQAYTMTEK